jgi:hypothetical protein
MNHPSEYFYFENQQFSFSDSINLKYFFVKANHYPPRIRSILQDQLPLPELLSSPKLNQSPCCSRAVEYVAKPYCYSAADRFSHQASESAPVWNELTSLD